MRSMFPRAALRIARTGWTGLVIRVSNRRSRSACPGHRRCRPPPLRWPVRGLGRFEGRESLSGEGCEAGDFGRVVEVGIFGVAPVGECWWAECWWSGAYG